MQSNGERETKIIHPDANLKSLKDKLEEIGASFSFKKELIGIWMQNQLGKQFRVRKEGDEIHIEAKKILSQENGVKNSSEVGIASKSLNENISDFDQTITFFEEIGFEPITKSIKTRVEYLLNGHPEFGDVKFHIDKYTDLDGRSDIPEFMELEAASDEILLQVALKLGFKKEDMKDWGVKELLENFSVTK